MVARLKTYSSKLGRLVRRPSMELDQLQNLWPATVSRYNKERTGLLNRIPQDDPIRKSVDLLHSIKCASDETLHTQALAYALDPAAARGHEFGKSVLISLLEKAARISPRRGAGRVLRRVNKKNVSVSVIPEFRFRLEGASDRSIARSDVWIEIKVRTRTALMVIENKIGAAESEHQLAWYERKVASWCKKHKAPCLLIFLTRNGDRPKSSKTHQWISMSYLELAAALRIAWARVRKAAGAEWLALYIASITRGVLGIDFNHTRAINLEDLKKYLGKL